MCRGVSVDWAEVHVNFGEIDLPVSDDLTVRLGVWFPELAFYIHDHLGNTRVLYANELIECNEDSTKYIIEHALDYFPYGRTLRHYTWKSDRFQTTHHERDLESGLDYRGARFYDSDVPGFLSVDPLSADFAEWSTYNYTFDNPVRFIDPDGRTPQEPIVRNGRLVGYRVERGQGPTQIAADLNSTSTQAKYGFSLNTKATHLDIVNAKPEKFQHISDVTNVFDIGFYGLDINPGDIINLSPLIEREEKIETTKAEIADNEDKIAKVEKKAILLDIFKKSRLLNFQKFSKRWPTVLSLEKCPVMWLKALSPKNHAIFKNVQ